MKAFTDYARYYDLLYKDKNYAGEAAFVHGVLSRHGRLGDVLDLGCGTGRHALEMARHGVRVTGVDMSETMLAAGRAMLRASDWADFSAPLPELHRGDARTVRLDSRFDAVTALFHVMSYQTTENDALAVLRTAYAHLADGGLFLFDFWHGPGVLADPPARRVRTLHDGPRAITRTANPELRAAENIVVVTYTVVLKNAGENPATITERHMLRYWFVPELRRLADRAGFDVVTTGAWECHDSPGPQDWYAYLLLQKRRVAA